MLENLWLAEDAQQNELPDLLFELHLLAMWQMRNTLSYLILG